MYYTFISKKQIGVIFSNWKKGNLDLTEEMVKFLYNDCAEVRAFKNNNDFENVLYGVKTAIDFIFAGDMKEAEQRIKTAYNCNNIIHGINA